VRDATLTVESGAATEPLPPRSLLKTIKPLHHCHGSETADTNYQVMDPVWAEDKVYPSGESVPARTLRFVSPGFFAATGTRLIAGRDITWTEWREVVGVIQDVRNEGAQFKSPSIVYFPAVMENGYGSPLYVQRPVAYTIRTDRAGTQSFFAETRAAVWSVNPNLPVFLVSTMQDLYDQSLSATSFTLVW
jgi:putative ABC transport system permease protein